MADDIFTQETVDKLNASALTFNEVVTSRSGGVSTGAVISQTLTPLGEATDTLKGRLDKLGVYVSGWTSTDGGTLTSPAHAFLNNTSGSVGFGNYYSWSGAFPKTVAPGTDPAAVGSGYTPRTDVMLRDQLLAGALALRNNEFALRDFVSIFDGFGVAGDGVTYDNAAISTAIASQQNLIFPPATYKLNAAIASAIGSNKKLLFMPGAKFISDNLSDGIMYFHGVGDGFCIIGNPTLEYSSVPTVRLMHTICVCGESITNLLIDGPEIKNGANMAVAVFCGKDGNVAVGSKNITVCNIKSSNTLGDTVHIEGADSDVNIYNIHADNSGDDVVAVLNYTGTGPAPTHPTQTKRVQIRGITSSNAVTSTISLGGVADFVVDGVVEQVKAGAACLTVKMVHAGNYTVGNSDGVIDNIVTDGALKIIAVDTPSAGTAFNRNITFGKIRGKNVSNTTIFASNSDTASSGRIDNIVVEDLVVTLASTGAPFYISNTRGVHLKKVEFTGGNGTAFAANNEAFGWGKIKLSGLLASANTAMTVVGSYVTDAGSLDVNASNRPVGVQYQSNPLTRHNGRWDVTGATTQNFLFGSNSLVSGYFGSSANTQYIGASVVAGTETAITFVNPPVAAIDAPNVIFHVSVASNEGGKWGYKNVATDKLTMVWSENLSYVFVSYIVRYRVV